MERTYLAVFAQSPEDIVELLGAMDTVNRVEITSVRNHSLVPDERVERWATARVEDQLNRFWVSQMDRYSDWTINAVLETIEGLGLLGHTDAILWANRMRGCPVVAGVVEDPARKWCAYCGDLSPETGEPEPTEWTEPLVMAEPEPMPEPPPRARTRAQTTEPVICELD